MKDFIDFFTLSDPNARIVLFGAVILGIYSSAIGCFTLLRKRALVGDAVAHSVLPGICLAFIIQERKEPLVLLLGAFISKTENDVVQITIKIGSSGLNDIIQTFRRYSYNIISGREEDTFMQDLKERSDYLNKYLNL